MYLVEPSVSVIVGNQLPLFVGYQKWNSRSPGLEDAFFTPITGQASNRSEISYFPFGQTFSGNPGQGSYCTGTGKIFRVGAGRGLWGSYAEARESSFVKARISCREARNDLIKDEQVSLSGTGALSLGGYSS